MGRKLQQAPSFHRLPPHPGCRPGPAASRAPFPRLALGLSALRPALWPLARAPGPGPAKPRRTLSRRWPGPKPPCNKVRGLLQTHVTHGAKRQVTLDIEWHRTAFHGGVEAPAPGQAVPGRDARQTNCRALPSAALPARGNAVTLAACHAANRQHARDVQSARRKNMSPGFRL